MPSTNPFDSDTRLVPTHQHRVDETLLAAQRRAAVRQAATLATDAADLALILAALGLDPEEGR